MRVKDKDKNRRLARDEREARKKVLPLKIDYNGRC